MKLKQLRPDVPTRLSNMSCPYCGVRKPTTHFTEDHVIARRFVPRGVLHQSWNLLLQACSHCNVRKSDLEDDLSAITMQADACGNFARNEPRLKTEAIRKGAGSTSRRSRKLVRDSAEVIKIHAPLALRASATFTLAAAPQLHEDRAFELARLQLSAFFYLLTYNYTTRVGGFWIGGFLPVSYAGQRDWGNCLHHAFMHKVFVWEPRLLLVTADGFFKAAIRRSPSEACWSWALEWNENYRLIGFFGDRQAALEHGGALPQPQMSTIPSQEGATLRFREEVPLSGHDDVLFNDPVSVEDRL